MTEVSTEEHRTLVVFDRLTVGPAKIEANRLTVPYRLFWESKEEQIELVYRYEEEVFDVSDSVCLNLAALIGAQTALNYGLFCKKITFYGPFDDVDRRFVKDMMENTAREIYVKKFLEPNVFLQGAAAKLEPLKKKKYSNAVLEFPDSGHGTVSRWRMWPTDRHRHLVLSSGGKDSLLSYGLLNEAGYETHPVFVNESGRHWFTALNAYRYFKSEVPNTGRVWSNCDRVFNWMVRRMSFIRQDYNRLRSDEYPIRLWTVAVFLFGVLPLMRKRNIARLVIGDEFDTTRRLNYKGITHYDGLYDQSRYFDNALSRYYMSKGWSITQFSILRPFSELLIQTMLVKRYPHLQRHQMSCHATHNEGDRILPCGKCEKCRRIVGMLTAMGEDPRVCGYTGDAIRFSLEGIVEKGVNQLSNDARHMFFLLAEKQLISLSARKRKTLKPGPDVMKLRFDPERSPIDGIPVDLRKTIYPIGMEHAEGAIQRRGREWNDIDPMTNPGIERAYSFEMDSNVRSGRSGGTAERKSSTYLWGELTWPEAENRFQEVDIALLPVGAIEQHGPHLPLDTDAFDAEYLCRRVAAACSSPPPMVLPLISYGVSYEHDGFIGTISISNDTLSRLVYDIGISTARSGIKKLVIINGHGGNAPALQFAAQKINRDAGIFVCVDTGETSDVDIYRLIDTPNDVHAGEIETSTSLVVRPELVKMEEALRSIPRFSSRYLNFTSRRGVSWYAPTRNMSPSGVLGDATRGSAEKGKKIWEMMIAHLVALVEDLKGMTLEEIYQRRY
jgi:creatinine amidohydrolase/Fe(II)-dependent formamide hydrolase-like protein